MKSAVVTVTFVLFHILIHDLKANVIPPRDIHCTPPMVAGCTGCGGTCAGLAYRNTPCLTICRFGCACPQDTYEQDNQCVPASKCVVNCPENKHFDPCPKFKEVTCDTLKEKQIKEHSCNPGCVCDPGYVLVKEFEYRCVKVSECPK
ncbi:alpha-tectorin-like [Spea bombifrons]|uniref:alpha-tectorin-like n=1 Tax=Spea bombifrons TaxID=233779 RepID=UPI00234AE3BC|nr:alpha-tectorin-like [Spea bombifrons]